MLQVAPVKIGGEIVKSVMMHNKKRLFEMRTGIGAEIIVQRIGTSITDVVGVIVESGDIPLPQIEYEETEIHFI